MTTLQQVHLKIQEMGKDFVHIPVDRVVHELGDNEEQIKGRMQELIDLKFIAKADNKGEKIKLTLMGKMSNLP